MEATRLAYIHWEFMVRWLCRATFPLLDMYGFSKMGIANTNPPFVLYL